MHETFRTNITINDEDTEIRLFKIGHSVFTASIPNHSHGSNNYELHYIPKGHGLLLLDETSYELIPGTLFVAGPDLRHAQETDERNNLCEYCLNIEIHPRTENPFPPFDMMKSLFMQDAGEFEPLFKAIHEEARRKQSGYKDAIRAYLKLILIRLQRILNEEKENPHKEIEPGRSAIIIEECFLNEYRTLTLDELAGKINLSERHTERLLRKLYGKTFREKLRESRIAASIDMLRNTERNISEIAEAVGYATYTSFSTAFRKETGQSPSEYKRKNNTL